MQGADWSRRLEPISPGPDQSAPYTQHSAIVLTTYRATTRDLLRLALPVTVVQVGMMAMGVVDTAMVGRVGAADLAAVALGSMYFFLISIFGLGVLMALDPVVAQGAGANDHEAVARGVRRGMLLALGLGLVASALHA